MKKITKIVLWILAALFLIFTLAFLPSIACIFAALSCVLIMPIENWQNKLSEYLTKTIRIIVIIVLTVLMFITVPAPKDKLSETKDDLLKSKETDIYDDKEETFLPETDIEYETEAKPALKDEMSFVPETEAHIHSFSSVTCTEDAVCECGEIGEKANGHTWQEASCTEAKKCSVCGITEGSEKGHSWEKATCTSAKKCSWCGVTDGSSLDHSYYNGNCSYCGSSDPNYVQEGGVWIPTKGGKKYHCDPDCSNMIDPEKVTESYAISQGFDACKRCY